MEIAEPLTALALLIDFLFGITFGVLGAAVHGSRRGALLTPTNDPISTGARALYGIYTRDDDGYLQSLLSRRNQATDDPHGDDGPARHGQGVNR